MSWFEDSNIKKSYIVQTVSDVGIFSACTQIYLTNISPCVGDTINITGNLGVSGNISGTTYFGDGSQLSGIVTTDNFVTGGVYSASSETLYFTGTTGFTPFSVDVSALLDNTNNYVTGGTYNSSTDIVTLTRNDNVNINITGVSDTFTTGATYNEGTELITFVRNDGNTYTADLAAIASATTNSFTTGATLNGNIIEFANSVLGLNYYNVDLTPIVSGATNGYTTGATLNGNIIEFANNLFGLDYYNVDLTSLVSGKLDTTSFNTYTADTQTTLNGKLDTASFNTYSGTVETQINNKTENTNFTSHTGDTTIHYTKGSINLSELGSSAHTHSISEITNLQTELDGKVASTLFNTYTGDTETSLNGKLDSTSFNTYSGSVQTELDAKVANTLFNTYTGDTETALGTKLPTTTFNSYTGSVVDVHVSSGNANAGTQQLSFTNTTGGTFNVTNSAALFSDNDINVTGGTYDINTGCVTFVTNSGTTFDVCGFVTGITDTFVTGGTLTGENLVLERSSGVDVGNIDLSGLVSGKLEISLFNTYTGDTQTALGNKTDNTNFVSHTGDTTIHYTKGSINLSELGSSAHTHSISEVVNLQTELDAKVSTTLFNTYTGDTETALGTKVSTASNIGGGEGLFSGKSVNDLQFKSLTSTGGTVTISTTGATVNLESAGSGGSSPWVDNGSSIVYSGHGDYVEFKNDYFQIAPTNTSNTLGTFSNQSVYIGTGITAAGGSGQVNRVYAQGQNHTLAATANLNDSFILGDSHTVAQGDRSFVIGNNINIGDVDNSFVGGSTINGSTASLIRSFVFNNGATSLLNDTSTALTLIGSSNFGFKGDNITGIGGDHYSTLSTLSKHYAFGDRIRGTVSRQTVIGMGTDSGTMLQLSSGAANGVHLGVASTRPSFGVVKATAKSLTTTATETTGLAYLGTGLPVALNVANTGDGAFWIEDVDTAPTANITDAGALYNSGGTITWWDGTTNYNLTSTGTDVYVSSGNANVGTQQLSFTNTTGGTFNVTNAAALFSDNDVNVTGGTYNASTGCVTFTTNSATTFDVCGFVTGLTDTFVTGGTLSGNNLVLERNSGVDVGNIDLSGLVSSKVETTLFNTYTGDTETALSTKGDVFKVGTPVNNQIGVWTGDGTLEGDTGLTWNTAQIEVTDTDNNLTEIRADWVRVYNETDDANLFLYGYGTGHRGEIVLGAANGDRTTPTATLNGNNVAIISAYGHSGTGFRQGGNISFAATENYTEGTNYGTRFVIQTVANGSTSLVTRYATDGDGNHDFTGDVSITGDVGIGAAIPQEKLHVSTGNDVDSGNISFLIGGTAGTNARTGRIIKNTSSPYEMTIRANDFATGGNLILNDTGGNVGIGTTSPTEALDVSGNTVMSGTLNIGTIGGTTSVTNLGIDSSGNVVSGTTGGGGGTSYWEETTSSIKLDTGETTRDVVEINTGGANTLSGTYSLGNLLVGDGNTFGNGQTVRRSFIGGNAVAVGASESFQTSIAFGQTMTVEGTSTSVFGASHVVKGSYNFTAGQNNDLYGDNLTSIGTNNILGKTTANINRSIVIGEDVDSYADDQIVIGFGFGTNSSWGAAKAIYVGIEDSRASSGWFSDPTIGSGTNFALGGNNTMRTDVGVIKAGAGRGILYLNNYTGSSVSEPTVDITDSVGLWAKNRDTGVTGLIVKAENGGKTWIGDRIGINTVTPTEALDVSGNTVMSGTLNIGTVNAGTAVKNLAVDTNDNVVASSVPITTTYRINSNADIDLFNDSTIQIRWDQSQTDIDMTILVDPTTSQVHVTKTKDGSDTTFDLENSDGATQIEGSMGTDDKIDIVAYAPSDNAYPHYRIKIVRSNSLNYTNSPFLVIVEKWTSYD